VGVAHDVAALLGTDGVARTADLARKVDRHSVDAWVRARRLLRPYPGVVVLPAAFDDWRTRALAAVYATDGVLSHTSALAVWRLAQQRDPVHVSVRAGRRALRRPGLVVHRVQDLVPHRLGPYPVTDLARALVDTWGLAAGRDGGRRLMDLARAAVITALRDRRVRPDALAVEIDRRPALPGRAGLRRLVDLVRSGSHSELEIWGVQHVLTGPGMPRITRQYAVSLPFATVHLDAAIPELRIAIELDGAAFHGSAEDRERDTRRDAALSALGWVVLRFTYRRLTTDPEGCRREILQVCAARRALLVPR
jgi:very-short-patch-repair endonuclease